MMMFSALAGIGWAQAPVDPDGDARLAAAAGAMFHFETYGLSHGAKLLEEQWGVPVSVEFHQPLSGDSHFGDPWEDRHAWPGAWVRMPLVGASPSLAVLEDLIDQVNTSDEPCVRFGMQAWEGGFSIVPTERRNEAGAWVAATPILSVPLTLPGADDPVRAAFRRGDQIDINGFLAHLLTNAGYATTTGGRHIVPDAWVPSGVMSGREALIAVSHAASNPVSWKLGWDGEYTLSVHDLDGHSLGAASSWVIRKGALRPVPESEVPRARQLRRRLRNARNDRPGADGGPTE
ncbi:MAG: hypothetical protein R3F61_21850 [Myxococcota bacterium]